MSSRDFMKGSCRQCGNPVEFPGEALNEIADCPHCGRPTPLLPDSPGDGPFFSHKLLIWIGLMMVIGLTGALIDLCLPKKPGPVESAPASPVLPVIQTNPAVAVAVVPAAQFMPTGPQIVTNGYVISSVKLESTPGSSLVYVTGLLQNLRDQPRYGVKVEFGLSDASHQPVGKATDYHELVEPKGTWHFRAMIMDSTAVSAHFRSVQEDQ